MLRILVLFFSLASFPVAALADGGCLPIDIVGSDYPDARKEVIKAGWVPKNFTPPFEGATYTDWVKVRNYAEVQSCAGTGLAPCRFDFELKGDNNSNLIVYTVGEEIGTVTSYQCAG